MSSATPNQGRQSPPPERQTGRQLNEVPASGQGTDETPNKRANLQDHLNNLPSNPKGPLDDAAESKVSKGTKSSS
ncbi:uncharacterized protein F4812DRAFT_454746 [Daldinia caldariorum]|uniref:uncharacterized protein n=1 Tax=Daldinia caldariorum TaxID=326644 RepID=UPI00200809AE|nr:uncharacterized protein F4812DRAFT_454746 [Daldinia caldariorum]KAI1472929.1 hypothetical protein F4812DRAFT_454746 [Daldinia caldariorum]